ncbi:MAG: alpha/beta hydrolase [Chloroflexi bacterium]|nr:MAG: alpha/beta hydrolase [Chloroflexota bacterium]
MASIERATHVRGVRAFRGRRLAIRLLIALVALLVLIYAIVSVAMAYQLTLGNHRPLGVDGSAVATPFQEVSFPSRVDDITLRGWLYKAPAASGRSVIIVHGFHQNRVNGDFDAVDLSKNLLAHGYDVLLFDLRSCGTSGGNRFTLGTLEPRDLLGAYDFMRAQYYRPAKMAVIGDSEGAATVIGAAHDLGAVGALVADSSFADLKAILDAQLPHNTTLPSIFFPGGELASGLFGLNPNLRPVDEVRALPSRAFLFFHGGADTYVPVANGNELRQASTNPQSELTIVPGADHVKSFRTNPALYLSTLYQFLDQQIPEHGG